jgi:magnesium chelatase family protein
MEAIKAGRSIIVAAENEAEVSLTGTKDCYIAEHLQAVCAFLEGKHELSPPSPHFISITRIQRNMT